MPQDASSASTILEFGHSTKIVVPDDLNVATTYILSEQGDWFEDEIRFVRRFLMSGMNVVDIGASFGTYTLSAAKEVGPDGCVWAFEPDEDTFGRLLASIAENRFVNVVADNTAVSDMVGQSALYLTGDSELNSLIASSDDNSTRLVNVTTLDTLMESGELGEIDLVKLDAEGAERLIVAGGRKFFERQSPLVQFEIRSAAGIDLGVAADLAGLGYVCYRLVPGLMLLVPFDLGDEPDAFQLNLFCCKPERAAELSERGLLVNTLPSDDVEAELSKLKDEGWSCLKAFPYAVQLARSWASSDASERLRRSIAAYGLSRDEHRTADFRMAALRLSFNEINALSDDEPGKMRLASLARIAADLGNRGIAVNVLKTLIEQLNRNEWPDLSEPFLAPTERFDNVTPQMPIWNWAAAAIVESFERLCAHSSFYAGASSIDRLEYLAGLGYPNAEMENRLRLAKILYLTKE